MLRSSATEHEQADLLLRIAAAKQHVRQTLRAALIPWALGTRH